MTYEEHPDADELRKIARGVTSVPAGLNRWRSPQSVRVRGFGWQGFALAGACAVVAVSATLAGVHRATTQPGPAGRSSTPSVAIVLTPATTRNESPGASPEQTPAAVNTETPRPTSAETSTAPGVEKNLSLNFDNNGQSLTIAKGGTISVKLPYAPSHNPPLKDWQGPEAAGNPPQLTRTAYSRTPGGDTTAQFTALAPTTSAITIEAWAGDPTMSGPPTWSVTITIV